MQPEEEFRSRLRDDLGHRPAPPVGALVPDALSAGRRMRRRRQTLRVVTGTAAVAAVAVGSVTLSGAFGSDAASSAVGPGGSPKPVASSPGRSGGATPPAPSVTSGGAEVTIPSSWTVPPAATVSDPAWVTPQAIVAEIKKLLPATAASSDYSGNYAYAGGDPRELWAVDGQLSLVTSKGPKEVRVTLHKLSGSGQQQGCNDANSCASTVLPDGSTVTLQHNWNPLGGGTQGAYISVIRKDGMSVQVTVRDQSLWTDVALFQLASDPAWGSLKMEKSFVTQADATIKGTFMNPPAGG